LLDVYRQVFLLEGHEVAIGLSIGIDIFSDGDSFAESCERADAAMYRIKHQGKNGYSFSR